MANKLRIGIIGAGSIATAHMHGFGQLQEDVILDAVTDINLELAKNRAKEFGVRRVIESSEELLQDKSIDAVVIAVPNKWHAPLAIQALQAGKHILLEKPMAINGEAAKEIRKAQKESGKIVMIPHQLRWQASALEVKKQVEDSSLGKIYYAKTTNLRRKGIPGWGSWFTQKELSGGGPLIDIGVHMLDLTLWLMGNPKPVSVYGSTYAAFGPEKKGLGSWGTPNWNGTFDVEDLATALVKMDDGSTLSLEVSWAAHKDTDDTATVQLMGTEGGALLKGNTLRFYTEKFNQPIDVDIPVMTEESERILLNKHFIECIREGKEPISSSLTGLTNNLIIDAIYESSVTGKEVLINWD
ncbi:MAG TPA: Gfo/Idh/MocA family oxidoreductase [Bacillaceae bacterium]|nr:Gfo/Idh/MocA family oxidoreductase [Paenibacillus bovis]HLU23095.1 Gfo/Idh/MocA family oxidoreductase [Bacillaceae bacterium]